MSETGLSTVASKDRPVNIIGVPVASFHLQRPEAGAVDDEWLSYYQRAYPSIYSSKDLRGDKPGQVAKYRYFENKYQKAQELGTGQACPLDLIWTGRLPVEFFEYDEAFWQVFQVVPELV